MEILQKDRYYLIPHQEKFLSDQTLTLYGVIHDGVENKALALERHFNDLYKFFLRKLGVFEAGSYFDNAMAEELTALLQEVIRSKKLLEETTE